MSPIGPALLLALFVLAVPWQLRALLAREHHRLTCDVLASICERLALMHGNETTALSPRAQRIGILRQSLCAVQCGPLHQGAEIGISAVPPCRFDLGAAVAAFDYEDDPDVLASSRRCLTLTDLRRSFANTALQALMADSHFCPKNRPAFANLHESALGLAVLASHAPTDRNLLFRAVLHEAKALHILEDAFAAGHLYATLRDDLDPFVTTSIHDAHNRRWTLMTIERVEPESQAVLRESWLARGEGYLYDVDNQVHLRHASLAVATALAEVLWAYVEGTPPIFPGRTGDLMPLCPAPDQMDARDHHAGELRVSGQALGQLADGRDTVRNTIIYSLGVGVALPQTEHLTVSFGTALDLYARRGLTATQLEAGMSHDHRFRGWLGRIGVETSFGPWLRLFRAHLGLDTRFGWVVSSNHHLTWNVPGPGHLGLDGADLMLGGELLLHRWAVRPRLCVGLRESGLGNGWDTMAGVGLGAALRW